MNERPLTDWGVNASARSSVVNRTHRVVRQRAGMIAARRSRVRSLWIPVAISSALVAILFTAVWTVLNQYDLNPNGIPDASNQIFVLLLWCLPVSMALLAVVLIRRTRRHADGEVTR